MKQLRAADGGRCFVGVALLLASACAAPPPPIAVETPYGVVRADSKAKATEVADLLAQLSPRVQAVLPGTQDRVIDVWVQSVLRSTRHGSRAKGVKGFTLLAREFEPKRIHLLEDGELSWYLSHELVHALLNKSWAPLPGLLEEGLGDVVAEQLNPAFADRIRAHRLFTASGFSGGVTFTLVYTVPGSGRTRRNWAETSMRLQVLEGRPAAGIAELLEHSRHVLRKEWRELPEAFYGLAYLIVSRIVERHGLDGLYELCLEATRNGQDLISAERILAAAELDPLDFDADFLATMFGRSETRQLLLMQPKMFGDTVAAWFKANHPDLSRRELLYRVNPSLRTADGGLLRLRTIWPVRERMIENW
ncbi:MAG: hypothetical protein O7B99_07835 [Planctomycetota bacterium]|nr:hypothetical protein [Planctomycetota bacterium]